ncbi:hypothetical protein GIB67_035477 [Kingdonia uniflora]|uniref:RNase H type-1 domain-containing protein n=1 Tax=Kingdonia uniflora TaxID=39325 RepID=A0A7J7P0Q3_9MAGN|nr:hypothetical protein GIB67_035477 [Kingdonia uniflora]
MIPCREKIAARLSLTDISCPLCSATSESLHHLILDCAFTRAVWFSTSFGGMLHRAAHLNVREWIELWISPPTDWPIERDTWTLTINKLIANKPVFKNERISIKVPWGILASGWKKIDVDASFCKNKCFNCIGIVIRDSNNVFDAVRVSTHKFASSEEGEAITVLEGVHWARVRGNLKVIIETDAEAIYSFYRNGGANIAWSTKAILQDCLALIDPGINIRICCAPRSANVVAHTIAERPMSVMSVLTCIGAPKSSLGFGVAPFTLGSCGRSIAEADVPILSLIGVDSVKQGEVDTEGLGSSKGKKLWILCELRDYDGSMATITHPTMMYARESSVVVENVVNMPGIGKRRKDVILDDIVEVKQDELMKNRSKEDHAKLTRIAFGPSYQTGSEKTYTMWSPPSAMLEDYSPSKQVFVYLKVPETKGMPLEVICKFFSVCAKQSGMNN